MNIKQLIAGRFEVAELIRQGGMGEVYRALDQQSGEWVALKRLKAETQDESGRDAIARFVREGELLRTLNHPNIVKIVTAVEENGSHYLVMEYVKGGSLADLLVKQSRLAIAQSLRIALDLTDALTRAHRLDVIHRDIKPENVLMADDGTPRLTDFGLARLGTSTITQSGVMVGTYMYLAPEAFQGHSLDIRADIWAFGVMLFQMLVGKRPFEAETPGGVMAAVLTHKTPDVEAARPDTPPGLADLIYRMLEKDPLQRIQSMRIVGGELEKLLKTLESGTKAVIKPARPTVLIANSPSGSHPSAAHPSGAHSAGSQSTQADNNLPRQTTSFIGRDQELDALVKLVDDPAVRLITILGTGGMGKTRLAIEMASNLRADFADGVFFVALAPLASAEWIVPTLAETVHFTFYQGIDPKAQLIGYLRGKAMLLVLDNFEHLLAGVELLNEIMQEAPRVKLVVTSRERLNLRLETPFVIDGMPLPDLTESDPGSPDADSADLEQYDAIKLFLQSAHAQQPNFDKSPQVLRDIAHICRLVQGLPLAIELAASWVEMLSLPEISTEIETNLDFLETDLRDVPARQRSIRAVFDYTWRLLEDVERDAFKRLSIFRGGFTREAAQQVADAALRTLMRLMNKSLLRRDRSGRYELHELLRQYAAEQLQDAPAEYEALRDKHSAYYVTLLHQIDGRLKGYGQKEAIAEIEMELDNVRLAWERAIQMKRLDAIAQALEPLWNFYIYRDRLQEGESVFSHAVNALRSVETPSVGYGLLLALHGALHRRVERSTLAEQHMSEGVAMLTQLDASHELALANIWNSYGTSDEVIQRLRDCRAVFEAHSDRWGMTAACFNLAMSIETTGNWIEGRKYFSESLNLARTSGDSLGQAAALSGLGWNSYRLGKYPDSLNFFKESRQIYRQMSTPGGAASALRGMGTVSWLLKDYTAATEHFFEALDIYRRLGVRTGIAATLSGLGMIAWLSGNHDEGVKFAQESITLYRELDDPRQLSNVLVNLGHPLVSLGRFDEARPPFREAIAVSTQIGAIIPILEAMAGLAGIYGKTGRVEDALRLLAFAMANPRIDAETKGIVEHYMSGLKPTISPERMLAMMEEGRLLSMEQASKIALEDSTA